MPASAGFSTMIRFSPRNDEALAISGIRLTLQPGFHFMKYFQRFFASKRYHRYIRAYFSIACSIFSTPLARIFHFYRQRIMGRCFYDDAAGFAEASRHRWSP